MFEHIAAILAGYLFALLVGHWAIGVLLAAAGGRQAAKRASHPAAIGLLERAIYVAAWQLGVRWFIGLWLGLKVLGNWHRWAPSSAQHPTPIPDRSTFNLFQLGAGASVAFGVSGALITEMLDRNNWANALVLAAIVAAAALGLAWFLRREQAEGSG